MWRHKSLAFIDRGLSVAYRGSLEPQTLEVHLQVAKNATSRAPRLLRRLPQQASFGMAGGAEFHPTAAVVEVVKGPLKPDDPGAKGPSFAWKLKIRGVSPLFFRSFVDRMAVSTGNSYLVENLEIVGSLQVDDSNLSVDDAKMRTWVQDPAAYLGAWADPGFEVVDSKTIGDLSLRVGLSKTVSKEVEQAFEETIDLAFLAMSCNFNRAGNGPGSCGGPQIAKGKREVTVLFPDFNFISKPARDLFLNAMTSFSKRVAEVTKLEIGIPG